jgi:hypothetical protein
MSKKQESGKENGRFSAQRKSAAVLRLLRGEDLDLLSREYKVTAAKLSQWRTWMNRVCGCWRNCTGCM